MGVDITAKAQFIVACHCTACQHRTGSPFGAGAYYDRGGAATVGDAKEFRRPTDSGGTFRSYFCTTCGTSVFWTIDEHPGLIGVALGTIARPPGDAPIHSLFERSKHPWIRLDDAALHSPAGYPG